MFVNGIEKGKENGSEVTLTWGTRLIFIVMTISSTYASWYARDCYESVYNL